jgi:hypothetical protein
MTKDRGSRSTGKRRRRDCLHNQTLIQSNENCSWLKLMALSAQPKSTKYYKKRKRRRLTWQLNNKSKACSRTPPSAEWGQCTLRKDWKTVRIHTALRE